MPKSGDVLPLEHQLRHALAQLTCTVHGSRRVRPAAANSRSIVTRERRGPPAVLATRCCSSALRPAVLWSSRAASMAPAVGAAAPISPREACSRAYCRLASRPLPMTNGDRMPEWCPAAQAALLGTAMAVEEQPSTSGRLQLSAETKDFIAGQSLVHGLLTGTLGVRASSETRPNLARLHGVLAHPRVSLACSAVAPGGSPRPPECAPLAHLHGRAPCQLLPTPATRLLLRWCRWSCSRGLHAATGHCARSAATVQV